MMTLSMTSFHSVAEAHSKQYSDVNATTGLYRLAVKIMRALVALCRDGLEPSFRLWLTRTIWQAKCR